MIGGEIMTGKLKKTFYVLVLLTMLAGGVGCATTASVGLGYHAPISPHIGTGVDFGIFF
jgi:hypothetical protein